MDTRARNPAGRSEPDDGEELLRRAVAQVRATPAPTEALARALTQSQSIASSPPWRRWLLRGEAGRN